MDQRTKPEEELANELEIGQNTRQALMDKVAAFANQYLEALPKAKAYDGKEVNQDAFTIGEQPKTIEEILTIFKEQVTESGIRASSGKHFGYIPGGGIYASSLGDYLAAITNEYAGIGYASPGAVAMENEVLHWLKKLFSFPETSVGNLTSGGSIANLIALTAARDKYGVKNEKIPNSVIYLTPQTHHCIQKSLRIIGLEDVIIRYIPVDERYKMDTEALERQIQADQSEGLFPYLVIGSAGTTDVGAIDPLDEIGQISQRHGLWFHVDGAYGGFFIMTSKKDLFRGLEKADSLVIDPHKSLFLPYGIGAVLVKDAEAVLQSNLYMANYMQDALSDELAKDPANVSPELTKHFRALRIWLPLQLHGIAPFIANLEEKLLLTTYFRDQLIGAGFRVGPKPDLSVSYFWYPYQGNQNTFNRRLLHYIHEDGRAFFSSTILEDKFVIRMAILSFRTKKETIGQAMEMILTCLEKTKEEFGA
ncbi:aminotransferase class V-fold PLP-dependent enzyme [Cecembia sp.]|uniref:pyridoxal phosphate-dependent decarboxylase family protein n=1 Tax=Cecembia sp. TaxID=1898110 RepID=UPI0025BB2143|nr:aminotransferase class V-fold PLP-dependent enzyme [Cecembia sp.]